MTFFIWPESSYVILNSDNKSITVIAITENLNRFFKLLNLLSQYALQSLEKSEKLLIRPVQVINIFDSLGDAIFVKEEMCLSK